MGEHLKSIGVQFKEVDLFSIRLQSGETISVESIHGIAGYHIVKFSSNSSLSEGIIEYLTK